MEEAGPLVTVPLKIPPPLANFALLLLLDTVTPCSTAVPTL
jgi:hypothetical protein